MNRCRKAASAADAGARSLSATTRSSLLSKALPGVPHPVAPQARREQVECLHLHRRPAYPVGEGQDPCPHAQDIAAATPGGAGPAQPDHARLANYFKHAVCKHTLESLENFAWHRVIRWWMHLHRWRRKEVRRYLTGHDGRWRTPSAEGIDLFNIAKVPVTRHRYRGSKIPSSWVWHDHARTAKTVKSPLPEDWHGGFGERPGETDPEQSRHRAPGQHNHGARRP